MYISDSLLTVDEGVSVHLFLCVKYLNVSIRAAADCILHVYGSLWRWKYWSVRQISYRCYHRLLGAL